MNKILENLFDSSNSCKDHDCKMDKYNINKVYKPDTVGVGLKDKNIKNKLFGNVEPQLADCVIIYNKDKLAIIEIKCGTVRKKEIYEAFEQIKNVFKILEFKELHIDQLIFVYKSYDNKYKDADILKKKLIQERIFNLPITRIKYENIAIKIN